MKRCIVKSTHRTLNGKGAERMVEQTTLFYYYYFVRTVFPELFFVVVVLSGSDADDKSHDTRS